MSKSTIINKAMRCIDEVYAGADLATNEELFTYDSFVNEAARWVIDSVPIHKLGKGDHVSFVKVEFTGDLVARITLREDIGRLIYFNFDDGWSRPVTKFIYDTDIEYVQQKDKVLRGNPSRPVVAICEGGTILECYTAPSTMDQCYAYHVPYSIHSIPENLEDITAWKLAEVVLMSINDIASASVCATRVNEILQQLSL